MEDDRLRRALAALAAADHERASLAESVADWLTGGEGVDVIDLGRVLRFAWYELPVKWAGPPDLHRGALHAAAELFDHLGMRRYADVCRSPTTAAVHDAYATSRQAGVKAFQEAYRQSGIDPADLADFTWGDVMGVEEAAAHATAERALEEAMAAGRLEPGARGWRAVARDITAAALDAPHPELPGQTHRTAIVTERLDDWLRRSENRSPALHARRTALVNRLLQPIPVPDDVAERMAPVAWFLDRVDQGAQLTAAGYLPTAMVREGWERFEWDIGWTDRAPRTETEVVQIHELHGLLRRIKALRRRGKELRLSPMGRRMRDAPATAWRAVAAGLSAGEWGQAVAEVYTLLLLDGERRDDHLEAQAATLLGEMGWHLDGAPPDTRAVAVTWWATRRPLTVLGGIVTAGDWRSRTTGLTGFGEATLLEQLRIAATGPRSSPV